MKKNNEKNKSKRGGEERKDFSLIEKTDRSKLMKWGM